MILLSRNYEYVTFLVALLFSNFVYAKPKLNPPEPPLEIFRADTRSPQEIFNEGFLSWAQSTGRSPNNSLLQHVMEGGLSPSTANFNWVSTGNSNTANSYVRLVGGATRQPVWVYRMASSGTMISVAWAFRDYVAARPYGSVIDQVYDYLQETSSAEEWAVQGRIEANTIIGATPYTYNPATRQYAAGAFVPNSNFVQPPRPSAASDNPLYQEDQPVRTPALYEVNYPHDEDDNGSVSGGAAALPLGFSCLRTSFDQRNKDAEICNIDEQHRVEVNHYRNHFPSKLAVTIRTGNNYCFQITSNKNLYLNSCEHGSQFEYDNHQRLSTLINGSYWCLASNVPQSNSSWDYVKMEPCATNSDAQKWLIQNGKILTFVGNYPLQEYNWHGMVSKNRDGYDINLNKSLMTSSFFNNYSVSRSEQVELKMTWYHDGWKYYSTTANSYPWSSNYIERSYYDPKTNYLAFVDNDIKYCLYSNLGAGGSGPWQWTSWKECKDTDSAVITHSRWYLENIPASLNDSNIVSWKDQKGNQLWVKRTGTYAGFHFSAYKGYDYSDYSTKIFTVRYDALLQLLIYQ
ncbi:DUF1561 family protein [Photobacterium leiognathi]|uniref:DUF1561 family protein n=1 Tax=Photobacterium leiognathi TaxID=553611 RepID=UPI002981FAA2|nr:DUF1561 family protein [Photobacterium leiognathi]